jgi:hypothetical protein
LLHDILKQFFRLGGGYGGYGGLGYGGGYEFKKVHLMCIRNLRNFLRLGGSYGGLGGYGGGLGYGGG